jgi:hypothetical protein
MVGVRAFDQKCTLSGLKLDSLSHFRLVNIFLRLLVPESRLDSLGPSKIGLMSLLNMAQFSVGRFERELHRPFVQRRVASTLPGKSESYVPWQTRWYFPQPL